MAKALKPKTPAKKEQDVCPMEANLKKFAKTPIAMSFVKKHKGVWNHQDWLNFVEEIKKKGYDPIDIDKVGMILEEKKAQFLATQKD